MSDRATEQKRLWALYCHDLDSFGNKKRKIDPEAKPEEQAKWTFAGYEAWLAGYKAAQAESRVTA